MCGILAIHFIFAIINVMLGCSKKRVPIWHDYLITPNTQKYNFRVSYHSLLLG